MGDLGVKYIFESQDQLVSNIRSILKSLQYKDYNNYIEKLYEGFINDIYENTYTFKESKKILTTVTSFDIITNDIL